MISCKMGVLTHRQIMAIPELIRPKGTQDVNVTERPWQLVSLNSAHIISAVTVTMKQPVQPVVMILNTKELINRQAKVIVAVVAVPEPAKAVAETVVAVKVAVVIPVVGTFLHHRRLTTCPLDLESLLIRP